MQTVKFNAGDTILAEGEAGEYRLSHQLQVRSR